MKMKPIKISDLSPAARAAWDAIADLGTIAGVPNAFGARFAELVAANSWAFFADDGEGYRTGPHTRWNDVMKTHVTFHNGMPPEHYLGPEGLTFRAEVAGEGDQPSHVLIYAHACRAWGPIDRPRDR